MADKYLIVETSNNNKELVRVPDNPDKFYKEGQRIVISSKFYEDTRYLRYAKVLKPISEFSSGAIEVIEMLYDTTKLDKVVAICVKENEDVQTA